ncbi:MAG: type II toxin-antitoxin system VapC family toxin [Pseudomonadota bacterium]
MRFLLDTHVWLWLQVSPERLDPEVLDQLGNPENALYLSAASAWEIAIKSGLGKLKLPLDPARYVLTRLERTGIREMAVSAAHALRVAALPDHHRDPFDRLLVAQAVIEQLTLVSADPFLRRYDVTYLSATA